MSILGVGKHFLQHFMTYDGAVLLLLSDHKRLRMISEAWKADELVTVDAYV